MKLRIFTLVLIAMLYCKISFSQHEIPVTIETNFFWTENVSDEWIHLRITDTMQNIVVYDTSATVYVNGGFKDTVHLDTGLYKCEILDMGAYINNPTIKLKNGKVIPWGYQAYEYYLIELKSTYSEFQTSSCDSLISPSGNEIWKTTGIYYDTLENSIGADSLLTIDLTVNISTESYISATVCDSYTSPSGKLWTVSDTYMDTIPNAVGCDSIITINLTIDCTSFIYSNKNLKSLIFPNPVIDKVNIEVEESSNKILVEIFSLTGEILISKEYFNSKQISIDLNIPKGTYLMKVTNDKENSNLLKILKQ